MTNYKVITKCTFKYKNSKYCTLLIILQSSLSILKAANVRQVPLKRDYRKKNRFSRGIAFVNMALEKLECVETPYEFCIAFDTCQLF